MTLATVFSPFFVYDLMTLVNAFGELDFRVVLALHGSLIHILVCDLVGDRMVFAHNWRIIGGLVVRWELFLQPS